MKSSSIIFRSRSHGFALIEALIAVVVLATGLLALTALQGALTRSSADAKARSQIAAYITGEMDRIRSGAPVAAKSATATGTNDISIAARAAGVSTLSQAVGTDVFYCGDAGTFTPASPNTAAACGDNAWFRRVTLSLGWTDATGSSRALSMTTDISPLMLTSSQVLVDREPSDDLTLRPIVRRPSPVTEGMIPIATGGGDEEATAATNPKPKLLGGDSGTYVSDTRFDILTYSSDASTPSDFVRFNKKIETAVVGCTCQKSTAGFTGSGPGSDLRAFLLAKGYRPTFWNGTAYKTPVAATEPIDSSPTNVSQSTLCDVCCRDHKDPATEPGPKYSPWPNQDPQHYKVNASGALELAGNGEQYIEACRVIRVDGIFRVAADPRIQDNALVTTREAPPAATSGSLLPAVPNNTSATSPRLAAAGTSAYVNYAYDAVAKSFFSTGTVASTGNAAQSDFAAYQQSRDLNNPTYVPIAPVNDKRWLHSRVFMTDYLEADARARLEKASDECASPSDAQSQAQCVLPFVPLASINTTEIAVWSPRAASTDDARPAPLDALALNYLNFASSKVRRFNSGLALFSAVNPAEATTDPMNALSPALDEQLFVQLAAAAPTQPVWLDTPSPNPSTSRFFGDPLNPLRGYAQTSAPLPFNLAWGFPGGNPPSPTADSNKGNDPAATVTGSGACTPSTAANSSNPYACFSSTAANVEISIRGYNRIENEVVNNPCPGAPGGSKADRPMCVVYTFNGASVNSPASSVPASSYTLVSGAGTQGKLSEEIKFTVPGISSTTASTVTIDFTRATTSASTYTCSGITPTYVVPCQ